jgi:hypothetical protein
MPSAAPQPPGAAPPPKAKNGKVNGAVSAWIDQAFNLKGFDYCQRDSVLDQHRSEPDVIPL